MIRRWLFLCALLAGFTQSDASPWDLEYWQAFTLNNWSKGRSKLYTFGQIRVNNDISKTYYYQLTEAFEYQALKNLSLEARYTFIYDQPKGAPRFRNVNRLEFEVNPQHALSKHVTLNWRNRIEFAKIEHSASIRVNLRHRFRVEFALENCGRLKTWVVSDEIFYHTKDGRFTQNRFVPLQLNFELTEKTGLNAYVMLRNFRSTNRWWQSVVLGSEVIY